MRRTTLLVLSLILLGSLLGGCYTSIKVPISTYKPAYNTPYKAYKAPIITSSGDTLDLDINIFMTQYRSYPYRYYDYKIYYRGFYISPWVYNKYYYSVPPSPVIIYNNPQPTTRVTKPSSSKPRSSGTTRQSSPQKRQERPAREAKRNN